MKELIRKIKLYFTDRRFYNKLNRQIKRAEKLAYLSGRTYYVMNIGGVLGIYNHSELRRLINKRIFRKGVLLENLKSQALYVTAKQFQKNKEKA